MLLAFEAEKKRDRGLCCRQHAKDVKAADGFLELAKGVKGVWCVQAFRAWVHFAFEYEKTKDYIIIVAAFKKPRQFSEKNREQKNARSFFLQRLRA